MVELNLTTFTKRKNSTKRPESFDLTVDAVFKEACSDYNPTFIFRNDSNTFPWNYLEWGGWYYWIDNVIREKNQMVTVTCKLDPLATFKDYITGSTQFVAYDETANTEIPDTRLSKKTTEVTRVNSGAFTKLGGTASGGVGTVVIGVTGTDGISYFALTDSQAKRLFDYINTTTIPGLVNVPDIGDLTDVIDALASLAHNAGVALEQFLGSGSAADCVKSTRMIALPISSVPGSSSAIYLGKYNSGISGKKIDARIVTDFVTIAIPWTFTDWRRNAPYTEHYFFSPFIGLVHLSPSDLVGATYITANVTIDCISGSIETDLFATTAGGNVYIGTYTGSIAAEYAIGSSNTTILNAIGGVAAAVTGAVGVAAASTPAGVLAAGTAAIAGLNLANMPIPSALSGGGGGAALGLTGQCAVIEITHDTNVLPDSVAGFMGTPTMAVKSLSGLSGYVECRNASVAAPCSESELEEVNSFLNGGIYIE